MTKEQEEERILKMLNYLYKSMKTGVDNCDSSTVLNSTANLAVNMDRVFVRSEKSENFINKINEIDKDITNLKKLFIDNCECKRKY